MIEATQTRRTTFAMIIQSLLIAKTPGDKVDTLIKYDKSKLLKRVILLAYHPLKKFRMSEYETEYSGKDEGMTISKYIHILDDILHDKLDPEDATYACELAMSNINSDLEASLFYGIVKETDPLNLTAEIINQAWPNFIPDYPISNPSKVLKDDFIWPAVVQRHVRGMRINITVYNDTVEFLTKDGNILTQFDDYVDQFVELAQRSNVVFDGMAILVEDGKQVVEADTNDILTADPQNIKFVLWDSIRYDYGYIGGEDSRIGYNWRLNGLEHMMIVAQQTNTKPCYLIPEYTMLPSLEEAKQFSKKLDCNIVVKELSGTWHTGIDLTQTIIRI
jgi:hypothetical protein